MVVQSYGTTPQGYPPFSFEIGIQLYFHMISTHFERPIILKHGLAVLFASKIGSKKFHQTTLLGFVFFLVIFFTDGDPMGYITILHHHLGE